MRKQRHPIRNPRSLHPLNITLHNRLAKPPPLIRWQNSKGVYRNGATVLMVAAGVGECWAGLRGLGQVHGFVCDEVGSAFGCYYLGDENALSVRGGGVGGSG